MILLEAFVIGVAALAALMVVVLSVVSVALVIQDAINFAPGGWREVVRKVCIFVAVATCSGAILLGLID